MRSSIVGRTWNRQGWGLAVVLLLAGCSTGTRPLPTPLPTTLSGNIAPPAFVAAPADQALPALVLAERQASAAGDLSILAQLWSADAAIVDSRGTSETQDDFVWAGRPAILDRYRLAVFPSPPPPLGEADLQTATLQVDGRNATLQRNGDRWRFVQQDGRWWIQELVY